MILRKEISNQGIYVGDTAEMVRDIQGDHLPIIDVLDSSVQFIQRPIYVTILVSRHLNPDVETHCFLDSKRAAKFIRGTIRYMLNQFGRVEFDNGSSRLKGFDKILLNP